jgi:hypothetical protein
MDAVQNTVGRRRLTGIILLGLLALSSCSLTYNPDALFTPTFLPQDASATAIPLMATAAVTLETQTVPVATQPTIAVTPIATARPTVSIPTVSGVVAASSTPTNAFTATPLAPQAVSLPTQPPTSAPLLLVDCPVTSLQFSHTYDNPLTVSPFVAAQEPCYQLQAGAVVTLAWPGVPTGFREVTFYRRDETLDSAEIIGRDANSADGASIQWTVPAAVPSSLLYANVTNSADISDSIRVYVG